MSGIIVVIDGPDASGKGTQHALLASRIEQEGYQLAVFDFPQYGKPSAWFVERYLNGDFGTLDEIGPRLASQFYAADRYAAKDALEQALREGKVALLNRYVLANKAHQGGKITDPAERKTFYGWLDELEHGIYGIPRPTLNIVLLLDVELLQARVDSKASRAYLAGKKRDIHEDDSEHLRAASAIYAGILEETRGAPDENSYVMVPADGSPQEVHERIWTIVQPLLAKDVS